MEKYHRDNRAVREFCSKTVMRLIIMLVVISVVFVITQTPVITNNIAMGQMENSNEWFIAMSMYQKFAAAAGLFGTVCVAVTLGFIGWDGYKLAKILNTNPETENEKEN